MKNTASASFRTVRFATKEEKFNQRFILQIRSDEGIESKLVFPQKNSPIQCTYFCLFDFFFSKNLQSYVTKFLMKT